MSKLEVENYRFTENTALEPQVVSLLKACDSSFMPPLSDRVDLDSYAAKLFNHARRIEAWFESELVGMLGVYLNDVGSGLGFISNVCVHPSHWSRGIASNLIELCKRRALQDRFHAVELEVCVKNRLVVALYEKSGFSLIKASGEFGRMVCRLPRTDENN